jgi:hypothetical protein
VVAQVILTDQILFSAPSPQRVAGEAGHGLQVLPEVQVAAHQVAKLAGRLEHLDKVTLAGVRINLPDMQAVAAVALAA